METGGRNQCGDVHRWLGCRAAVKLGRDELNGVQHREEDRRRDGENHYDDENALQIKLSISLGDQKDLLAMQKPGGILGVEERYG